MDVMNMERIPARERAISVRLTDAPAGRWLRIHIVPAGPVHAQFIRFGIHEGERVRCIERLPGGTIVLQKNRQQIAIGHTLARDVFVVIITQEV